MDWFEKLTGLSPDHGNGTYEVTIIVAAIVIVTVVTWIVRQRVKNGR